MLGIDSGQVEIHLESTLMCPYRLSDRPAGVPQALDRVGNDRAADALQINRGRRMRRYDVAHERVGLVADVSGSTIDSRRAERLACAPIIVYSIRFTLPKLPNVTVARVHLHAGAKRLIDPAISPSDIQFGKPILHLDSHADTRFGILGGALRFGVPEEDQNCIADKLVDRAAPFERAEVERVVVRNGRRYSMTVEHASDDIAAVESANGGDRSSHTESDRPISRIATSTRSRRGKAKRPVTAENYRLEKVGA